MATVSRQGAAPDSRPAVYAGDHRDHRLGEPQDCRLERGAGGIDGGGGDAFRHAQ